MNRWIIAAHTAAMSRLDGRPARWAERSDASVQDDEGAITTETAVVTALLVLAASAVIVAIRGVAEGWVDAIPTGP